MESFDKLQQKIRAIAQLVSAVGIVQWDMHTMIPPRGYSQRADQLALMNQILHQMITDTEIGELLENCSHKLSELDQFQRRELELITRQWKLNNAVPEKLVIEKARQRAIATSTWRAAKSKNDWKSFEPELAKLVSISKEEAELLMEPTGTDIFYDALLDTNEPGMRSKIITKLFTDLRKELVPLARHYEERCKEITLDISEFKIPIEDQKTLVTDIVNYVGFDTKSETAGGRIDESEHPFTTSYFDDTRMTVNYEENDIYKAIFGGLHEAGHSIQGQSRNPNWKWMLLGEKCSSGINESQARFIENIVGRSLEFWEYYYQRFQTLTRKKFKDVSLREFVQAANIIKPSKIRVTADEMTYALHIIIRYEIELGLFSDDIEVSEIPQVWNEKYKDYLGVDIENDTEGALQDTHWAWGYWGYFPSYTLGNVYSGMILERLEKEIPDWRQSLSSGSPEICVNWLKENVHYKANLYDPGPMMEEITGKKLTSKPFIEYLENKYAKLFD